MNRIRQINQAAITALEHTAEELHREVVQAQVMPRDTGAMQGENGTFIDTSQSAIGKAALVTSTPYVRRLYYHPEYHFHREKWIDDQGKEHEGNPNARGKWLEPWMAGGEHEDFVKETFAKFLQQEMKK